MAKRISVINFKGGVGKTTLAFNLGAGLAKFYPNTKVLLVDVDHQSSLSIVCMGAKRWAQAVAQKGTVAEIFRPFVDQSHKMDGATIVETGVLNRSGYENLDLAPATLELDDLEIELTATHHGNAIRSEWDKRTLICRWLDESKLDKKYDYIIFDCPPATKIIAQNAIAASHGYVLPVVPEAVMERGAPHLVGMVKSGIDAKYTVS